MGKKNRVKGYSTFNPWKDIEDISILKAMIVVSMLLSQTDEMSTPYRFFVLFL